ncbi:MAG TPA: site-specific integrase, partial [Polyangiaceae bacterium]|nr:site-specific integrase [Polyangiaceae bacterium]
EAGVRWHVWAAARPPRGDSAPAGRALTRDEQHALLAARTPRDLAMVAVLLCGLRVGELVRLDVADFDHDTRTLLVRGKGRKQRRVALTSTAIAALDAYVAGGRAGPMFTSRTGESMTVRLVQSSLETIARRAGVRCTCHDLRRTAITHALAAGVPIADVATHVGHASIETTRRYDRPDPLAQSRRVAAALGG